MCIRWFQELLSCLVALALVAVGSYLYCTAGHSADTAVSVEGRHTGHGVCAQWKTARIRALW